MASYTSTQSGTWDDAATWGGGGSPVSASASTDEGSNTNWSFITPGVANYYNPGIKVTRKTQVLIA
jgi:hypothetical protein